ncbi:unnamed protein product [Schistosoma turkestanicum]|nr:unnamed protein product [Schistosoma turkestanicum]
MVMATVKEDSVDNSGVNEKSSEDQIPTAEEINDDAHNDHDEHDDGEEEDVDEEEHEFLLKQLWGKEIANYFLNPNFQKSSSKTQTISTESTERLLGGYPNGMLHGARIPFHPELKPWLFDDIKPSLADSTDDGVMKRKRKKMKKQSRRRHSLPPSLKDTNKFDLIDLLRHHMGVNYGAQHLWNLLRYKSYEQLNNLEKQLIQAKQDTFTAFTHECLLWRNKKPPLCDFIRENPSKTLSHVMNQLKAPSTELKLRKHQLSVTWANRNQDQFRILSFQQHLKDAIKSIEQNNFDNLSMRSKPYLAEDDETNAHLKISNQKAHELLSLRPELKTKQNETFIGKDLQHLENYFPDYSQIKDSVQKQFKPSNLELDTTNSTKTFNHLSFWNTGQPMKLTNKTEIKYQLNDTKPVKKPFHQSKLFLRQQPTLNAPMSIMSTIMDTKLQPLCWSDLLAKYAHKTYTTTDNTNTTDELLFTASSLTNKNSIDDDSMIQSSSFTKKPLWQPAEAIVS